MDHMQNVCWLYIIYIPVFCIYLVWLTPGSDVSVCRLWTSWMFYNHTVTGCLDHPVVLCTISGGLLISRHQRKIYLGWMFFWGYLCIIIPRFHMFYGWMDDVEIDSVIAYIHIMWYCLIIVSALWNSMVFDAGIKVFFMITFMIVYPMLIPFINLLLTTLFQGECITKQIFWDDRNVYTYRLLHLQINRFL